MGDTRPPQHPPARGASGWVVWIAVASAGLVLLGCFLVAQGLGALLTEQRFLLRDADPVAGLGMSAWGWLHVALGVGAVVAGVLVLAGRAWARGVGVAVAALVGLLLLPLLGEHPVWAAGALVVVVLVVVALTRHGEELRPGP